MSGYCRKRSISEGLARQNDEFDASSLCDAEADGLLRQLEVAHARAIASVYRFWPRERQYAFDRESGLVACLLVRQFLATLTEGYGGLTGDELAFVVRAQRRQLKAYQIELARLRLAFFRGVFAGTA